MSAILTIARREVLAFFVSPIAYVVATVWLLMMGIAFSWFALLSMSQPPSANTNLVQLFFGGSFLFYLPVLVFSPMLTMRLLAEERTQGTIETLLTAPVTELQIVLGKYLAALLFWISLWVPTVFYVWIAAGTGTDVLDLGAVGSSYLGVFFMGVHYMAIGLFMSAVARSQIVAAMLTFLVIGGLFFVGLGTFLSPNEVMRAVFEYVGPWAQMVAFSKGIVDTRYLVFDLSLTVLALFMAVRVLQTNRGQ
jgi:ABC-2 type transport system permease protein